MKFILKLWSIGFVFFCYACEKDVSITPTSDFNGTVYIEGLLSPGESPSIFVSSSVPFMDKKVKPQEVFARGAAVSITNRGAAEMLVADSVFDKFRCRWVPFYQGNRIAEFGERYDLTVVYAGKTYTASTTISQPKPVINEISYVGEFFDVYGGHDGVKVIMTDAPGPGDHYRFQMNRKIDRTVAHAHVLDVITENCTGTDEFWTYDIGRTVFSDEGNDGGRLDFLAEVSFEYSEGDSAWVHIQSLDKASAKFYQDLDDQLISILNPFVEPVFLKSSIEGGAVGVFGSMVLSDSVLFIYPTDNP